eukprot:TRINITY_DN18015_c0_g1_i4.p2 TRINITY_DN18015_c0_g1~~TRINITY_DN18015_c0_g1_i4.p2  ORF type:complete len:239 (+),score=68.50 TRINITY_DN18015_c0_g1_i4:420-1136(+)
MPKVESNLAGEDEQLLTEYRTKKGALGMLLKISDGGQSSSNAIRELEKEVKHIEVRRLRPRPGAERAGFLKQKVQSIQEDIDKKTQKIESLQDEVHKLQAEKLHITSTIQELEKSEGQSAATGDKSMAALVASLSAVGSQGDQTMIDLMAAMNAMMNQKPKVDDPYAVEGQPAGNGLLSSSSTAASSGPRLAENLGDDDDEMLTDTQIASGLRSSPQTKRQGDALTPFGVKKNHIEDK